MKKYINTTSNNYEIFAIEGDQHMLAHPVAEEDLRYAISKIELNPPFGFYTVDFGEPVGLSNCVEVTNADDIRYECREGRDMPSKMVYGRRPEATSLMTVGICTDDDGKETVFTAFYGELAPKELSDPRLTEAERPKAEAFWASHALVAQKDWPIAIEADEPTCYCRVALTINGIVADMEDFGEKDIETKSAGWSSDPDAYTCTCIWEPGNPDKGICAKYGISEQQFREIADLIEERLEGFKGCQMCQ